MHFRGPISAVCLHGNLLFAGSGPYLSVYKVSSLQHELIESFQVFPVSLKITAIESVRSSIIVRAERTFKVLHGDSRTVIYDHG